MPLGIDLLGAPPEDPQTTAAEYQSLERESSDYSRSERFVLPEQRNWKVQYSQIYFIRLAIQRRRLRSRGIKQWPGVPVAKIVELEKDKESIVIGTLYKEMKLKPQILDEYLKTPGLDEGRVNFTAEDDKLVLEDESGRVVIESACLQTDHLVTGIVLAVRGRENEGGMFEVSEVTFVNPSPLNKAPGKPMEVDSGSKYLAIVSGLSVGSQKTDFMAIQMMFDYLGGMLGEENRGSRAAKVVRVIIAGNSLAVTEDVGVGEAVESKKMVSVEAGLRDLDLMTAQLSLSVPVDMMPGSEDPTTGAIPQKPFHRCLFPHSSSYSTFNTCTNPYLATADETLILGSAGQNVDDIVKYTSGLHRLDIMERLVTWGHIAPTTPETLGCYPFNNNDPFILEQVPNIFFAGNQPEFDTRLCSFDESICRLVLVPRFEEKKTLVLVDLETLATECIEFSSGV